VLTYQLEMGTHESRIVRECIAKRCRLPDSIANAPQLTFGLEVYFEAFRPLSTCRSFGFGAGPIPWTAVQEFAERARMSEDQADDLHYYVEAMDSAYLGHANKQKSA
jgi:hypothetical protein